MTDPTIDSEGAPSTTGPATHESSEPTSHEASQPSTFQAPSSSEPGGDDQTRSRRHHPMVIVIVSIVVIAALIVAGALLIPRLRDLRADANVQGTYTVRMADSNTALARAVLSKGSIVIDFPGHEGKISATLSKTTGSDDGVSFIASDITLTGDTASNLLDTMPTVGISASQLKVILGSTQPTITLPKTRKKGSPVGTWKISLSVLGVEVSASATFHEDKTLTTTETYPGNKKSYSMTWSSPSPGTVVITGKNGKTIETITIPHQ
ncbi:hypothetical protein [uncultured Bifidobacterium sp.]|uniref:hypothetical protein n=1 Tax=uncultured Bifidobacterium sp. TaxID=165187 RepID=UPI002624C9C6|nr:hypothetical protein [uncultured Bifidobacterium sp.]